MSTLARDRIKSVAWMTGRILLVTVGWLLLMAAYLTVHGLLQQSQMPPMMSSRSFGGELWEHGYFSASGSFKNDSAIRDEDQLIPQTIHITCLKSNMICTLATADVFGNFLGLNMTLYDITTWNGQQIVVEDNDPICVTQTIIIDRSAETFTMLVRKKTDIPEYAAKSPLQPCMNSVDKRISLVDGMDVYERRRIQFDQKYGLYLHAALFLMNALYFGAIWLWWRRRRAAQGALKAAN